MKINSGKRTGFTLIELLVVVGIIMILTGIGITVGPKMITKAKVSSSQSDLSNLSKALQAYAVSDPRTSYPPRMWLVDDNGTLLRKNFMTYIGEGGKKQEGLMDRFKNPAKVSFENNANIPFSTYQEFSDLYKKAQGGLSTLTQDEFNKIYDFNKVAGFYEYWPDNSKTPGQDFMPPFDRFVIFSYGPDAEAGGVTLQTVYMVTKGQLDTQIGGAANRKNYDSVFELATVDSNGNKQLDFDYVARWDKAAENAPILNPAPAHDYDGIILQFEE